MGVRLPPGCIGAIPAISAMIDRLGDIQLNTRSGDYSTFHADVLLSGKANNAACETCFIDVRVIV
jgi:hypothetical protein